MSRFSIPVLRPKIVTFSQLFGIKQKTTDLQNPVHKRLL